jgi:hypothetical protein
MSEYMVVCGQIQLDASAWKDALAYELEVPFTQYSDVGEESEGLYVTSLEDLFSVQESGDAWFDDLQRQWTLNEYDRKNGLWRFSVPFHDDLWGDFSSRGVMPSTLLTYLAKTTTGAADPVLLFWHCHEALTAAFIVGNGHVAEVPIASLAPGAVKDLFSGKLSAGLEALGAAVVPARKKSPKKATGTVPANKKPAVKKRPKK